MPRFALLIDLFIHNGERNLLTLGPQVPSNYPAMCGIQHEALKKTKCGVDFCQTTHNVSGKQLMEW